MRNPLTIATPTIITAAPTSSATAGRSFKKSHPELVTVSDTKLSALRPVRRVGGATAGLGQGRIRAGQD
jgi:hypothetical protein